MNDFVHCNKCFALPSTSGTKFWLTSCSHIFCSSCSSPINKDRCCSKCKSRCNVMPLDSSIKPEIKMYFEPIDKLLIKTTKIEKFQRTHRDSLMRYLTSEQVSKGNLAQEKWEKKVSELKKEINHLRNKLNRNDSHKICGSSIGFGSRMNSNLLGSSRYQDTISNSRLPSYNSGFGNSRNEIVTPSMTERITSLESPRSRGSSKITLRSVSSLSAFQAR